MLQALITVVSILYALNFQSRDLSDGLCSYFIYVARKYERTSLEQLPSNLPQEMDTEKEVRSVLPVSSFSTAILLRHFQDVEVLPV